MTADARRAKENAARYAAALVESGMVVGLGSGSTAELAVRALGERVRAGLDIVTVPTSRRTERLARLVGLVVREPEAVDRIDLTIDGADEVHEPSLALLKGRGGALVREKLVASVARRVVIMVDESKLVPRLGARFPVPVEVLPFGWTWCARWLEELGGHPVLRCRGNGRPFRSDNGNFILDVRFDSIDEPHALARALKALPGVVDHGIFLDLADLVVVGTTSDVKLLRPVPR
ncbi:MAG: ribose-5-phosphate isomerase RpiA [Thermomicrobium sp.]|nr:ribose-5-phosphate isomerase RpiA [Thermomicrobium sp.]MDW8059645.1 ribose-5-phosphate isomerase RpiA [Thermomicrobium sp.]